jgi:hypothetical protein
LTGALSRLIAVSENYPDLKANEQFRDLQAKMMIYQTTNKIPLLNQSTKVV